MIDNVDDLRKALKGSSPRFAGIVLYEGASLIDGAPVVAIANRIMNASTNEKTGAMVQTFIIRSDMHPLTALDSGTDVSIRGDCEASADSELEMLHAHAMGWRTFRVRDAHEAVVKGSEAVCPASKEAGYKTSCDACKACGGLSAKAKVSIVIVAHGAKVAKPQAVRVVEITADEYARDRQLKRESWQ